jgi:hypothetical protein
MEKVEIKNCFDCPLCNKEYDDWAVGDDTTLICNVNNNFIDSYQCYNENKFNKTFKRPNWCPLEKSDILITLKK